MVFIDPAKSIIIPGREAPDDLPPRKMKYRVSNLDSIPWILHSYACLAVNPFKQCLSFCDHTGDSE